MFTTFQTNAAGSRTLGDSSDPSRPGRSTGSRRISTSNACVECRRRKIRCDGTQPCGQCQWYHHPEACSYSKPAQRVVPSRKLVEKLNSSIEQHQMILSRLFGSKDLDSLVSLPREELLNLALSKPAVSSPAGGHPVPPSHERATSRSEGVDSLEALEEVPDHDIDWDNPPHRIQSISDDVNGLSMRIDRQSSYVGISSISAALKVIFKSAPMAKQQMQNQSIETALPSRATSPRPYSKDPHELPPSNEVEQLINSFFEKVFPYFPMIDEETFRKDWKSGIRKDPPWFAVFNMVLALGSMASGTSENDTHIIFFKRARQHINPRLVAFGNPNVEVLQALSMMGGYYLHYLNRPNEGDALMGAALRVACAIGVHREYVEPKVNNASNTNGNHVEKPADGDESATQPVDPAKRRAQAADIRRRTWWSIFCLDTWASMTTGRPSLGRYSHGVTVQEPGKVTNSFHPQDPERLKLLPLIHNTAFCKIATVIQDKLSATPLIPSEELVQLDADLVRWWEDLPSILTKDADDSVPEFLRVPRLVMKWRFHNLRIILHRPYLLSAALRKVPFNDLTAEEKLAISKCRLAASKSIEDIASECSEDVISGWNGVWLAYQAAFVPLVSLFTDISSEETEKWRNQVKTAVSFFSRMQLYSIAAKRSKDVISKLLDAAKSAAEAAHAFERQQEALRKVKADREQQREHQQKQHLSSHPHRLGRLITNGLKSDSLHSPHGSPIDPLAGNISPASFGGMPMGVGSMMSPGGTLHSPMAQVTSVPQGEFGFSHGHSGAMGNMHLAPIPPHAVPQGFWDDMMWDTFPEMGTQADNFAMGGFEGGWSGTSTEPGSTETHSGQWSYSNG